LIAPDAFKGSLTSPEAAEAMAAGICSVWPNVEIISMPLADGGEGTLDVLHKRYGGVIRKHILYADEGDQLGAWIESARLIGLARPDMQGDVFDRGSSRLGDAVVSALDAGARHLCIALGGSATVDGGLGLLTALGCRIVDGDGMPVSLDLRGMMLADQMDCAGLDMRLKHTRVTVLSDVKNPLCGSQGAVALYGLQKGLNHHQLAEVDAAMLAWSRLCERVFAVSVRDDAGAGAAGGLGFALKLLGARVESGADYLMHASDFEAAATAADWVLTGEGRSDCQTLYGKLPMLVATKGRACGAKTALISGLVDDIPQLSGMFDVVLAATPAGFAIEQAMSEAARLLRDASAAWAVHVASMPAIK